VSKDGDNNSNNVQVAKERLDSLFYLLFVDLPREQRRRLLSIRHASGDGALC
jgi:hypothetical protein